MERAIGAISQCIEYYSQYIGTESCESLEELHKTEGIIEGLQLALSLVKGSLDE
jgi:secreted Zn-dependent insulinase-like peptidase